MKFKVILFIVLVISSYSCQKNSFLEDVNLKIEEKGGGKKKKKSKEEKKKENDELESFLRENTMEKFADFLKESNLIKLVRGHRGIVFVPTQEQFEKLLLLEPSARESVILSLMSFQNPFRDGQIDVSQTLIKSCLSLKCLDSDLKEESNFVEILVTKIDGRIYHNSTAKLKTEYYTFQGKTFYLAEKGFYFCPLSLEIILNYCDQLSECLRIFSFATKRNIRFVTPKGDLELNKIYSHSGTTFILPVNHIFPEYLKERWFSCSESETEEIKDFIASHSFMGKVLDSSDLREGVSLKRLHGACECRVHFEKFNKDDSKDKRVKFYLRRENECKHKEEFKGVASFYIRTTNIAGSIFISE